MRFDKIINRDSDEPPKGVEIARLVITDHDSIIFGWSEVLRVNPAPLDLRKMIAEVLRYEADLVERNGIFEEGPTQ